MLDEIDLLAQSYLVWILEKSHFKFRYVNRLQEGEQLFRHGDNVMFDRYYCHFGLIEGNYYKYRYDGKTLYCIEKYKHNQLDGVCKYYYSNGGLKEKQSYKNGMKHGFGIKYFLDGKIYKCNRYFNNQYAGESLSYHENGSLRMYENIISNVLVGARIFWDNTGRPESYELFKDGEIIKTIKFDCPVEPHILEECKRIYDKYTLKN